MLGLPGLGVPELLLLLVLALIIFGPGKLPESARALRKALTEFRQASEEKDPVEDGKAAGDRHS